MSKVVKKIVWEINHFITILVDVRNFWWEINLVVDYLNGCTFLDRDEQYIPGAYIL